MRKIFRILIAALLFLAALVWALIAFTSRSSKIFNNASFSYASADSYQIGDASVPASKVKKLEIDWISGSITVDALSSGDTVSFKESAKGKIEENERLRWYLEGSTLHIKWCKSGLKAANRQKDLKVTLPSSLSLESITINGVSASIALKGLEAKKLDLNTVSGGVDLSNGKVKENTLNTVSGKLSLSYADAPKSIAVGSVSGDTLVTLPKGTGFKAEINAVSGSFSSSIPTIKDEKTYTAGNGEVEIEVGSVSGNLKVSY